MHRFLQFTNVQHWLPEILESIEELRELVPVVDPVTHVPSDANAADILTRGTASAKEIGSESTWVRGSAYLRKKPDQWPKSPGVNKDVPSEEIKASVNVVSTANFMALVENLTKSYPSLDTLIGALARIALSSLSGREDVVKVNPSPRVRSLAWNIVLYVAQIQVGEKFQNGEYKSLGAYEQEGLIVCPG